MNKLLMLSPLLLLMTVPHAQQKRSRVAFVNVQQLVAALPGNSNYLTLSKNVDRDLNKRQQHIRTLLSKAQSSPTAENRAALTKAQQDYEKAQTSYQARLAAAFKPLAGKIDSSITQAARSQGFSIVIDQQVAARSSLVIYAHPHTNLTPSVLKLLKK